jgi:diguanylate cyclase (GGDEF)-like protein
MPATQQHQLASVGSIFREAPRQIDMSARLGSGRFAMLLPYTDEHGAFLVAERIRERIAPLGIQMSFGVAGFPRSGASAQAVFQAAETGLAEAREAGGNRVIIFQRSSSSARVEIDLEISEQQPLG